MASSPRAIVSPSVLASNFADLGNEIKRMMHCGAEWVHMGALPLPLPPPPPSCRTDPARPPCRCHGRPLCPQHHHGRTRPRQRPQDRRQRVHGLPHDGGRPGKGPSRLALALSLSLENPLTLLNGACSGSSPSQRPAASRTRSTSRRSRTPVRPSSLLPSFPALADAQHARRIGSRARRAHPLDRHARRRRHLARHAVERHLGQARRERRHAPRHDRRPRCALSLSLLHPRLVETDSSPLPPFPRSLASLSPLAGAGGQKFMQSCVPKVAELRTRFPTKDIQVDGGVGPGTVGCCARAGASRCSSRPCAFLPPRARSRGLALPAQPH